MMRSMTGYARADGECSAGSLRVEVRSVNHKVFKFSPRLPEFLRYKEGELENIAKTFVKRGHLYLNVDADLSNDTLVRLLDRGKLISYIDAVCEAVSDHEIAVTADVSGLLGLPGVMEPDSLPGDMREEIFESVSAVLKEALEGLDAMRKAEGCSLENQFVGLCKSLEDNVKGISDSIPGAVRAYQERLRGKVDDLLGDAGAVLDGDSLSREVAIMAERSDVAEELERLKNHSAQFRKALSTGERGIGKKLEFLVQEMHREANTLGSKLPSTELVHTALDIKSNIHQLREQVMNVE